MTNDLMLAIHTVVQDEPKPDSHSPGVLAWIPNHREFTGSRLPLNPKKSKSFNILY